MRFFTKSEILANFARKSGFETFLYIIEFEALGPKYCSDTIRNGKSTPELYFQAVYIDDDFRKISKVGSGFVLLNLAFGLIYEARSQVGLDETRPAPGKVLFFYI